MVTAQPSNPLRVARMLTSGASGAGVELACAGATEMKHRTNATEHARCRALDFNDLRLADSTNNIHSRALLRQLAGQQIHRLLRERVRLTA